MDKDHLQRFGAVSDFLVTMETSIVPKFDIRQNVSALCEL